jgi:transcription elongation factor Elf1
MNSTKQKPLKTNCPKCRACKQQSRNGRNQSGTQRARCGFCGHCYTLLPRSVGYSWKVVSKVIHSYLKLRETTRFIENDRADAILLNPTEEGLARSISRKFGINHQTILNWLHAWPAEMSFDDYMLYFPIRSTLDKRASTNTLLTTTYRRNRRL